MKLSEVVAILEEGKTIRRITSGGSKKFFRLLDIDGHKRILTWWNSIEGNMDVSDVLLLDLEDNYEVFCENP